MPTTQQTLSLTERHQLLDLNKEYVNFKLTFYVTAQDPQQEFEALVLEQKQLDANPDLVNLEMKRTRGKIGGSIATDKDVYQNYFLVLRGIDTTRTTDVTVSTTIDDIPAHSLSQTDPKGLVPETSPPGAAISSAPPLSTTDNKDPIDVKKPFYTHMWFILLLVGIVLGSLLYYYLFYVRRRVVVAPTTTDIVPPPGVVDTPPAAGISVGAVSSRDVVAPPPAPPSMVTTTTATTPPALPPPAVEATYSKDALYTRLKAVSHPPPSS